MVNTSKLTSLLLFLWFFPSILDAQPLADAGQDIDLCAESTSYTLQGNAPASTGQGGWRVVSLPEGALVPAFSDPSDPNAVVSNLLFPSNSGDSVVYEFEWTLLYPASSSADTVRVTRWKTPSDANAGSDLALGCEVGVVTLDGNAPAIGKGKWTLSKGAGEIQEEGNPNTSITGLGYGENIFTWTISNGPACSPSVSNVTIIRYANPVAEVAEDTLQACLSDTQIQLLANNPKDIPGLAQGKWEVLEAAGELVVEDDTLFNTTATFNAVGVYRLRWSVNSGTCGAVSDELRLEVFAPPVAAATPLLEVCTTKGSSQLLGNNPLEVAATAQGEWKQVTGPGKVSFTDSSAYNTEFTWNATGTYQLTWNVRNGGGCNVASAEVQLIVYEQPQSEAGVAVVSCLPNGPAQLGANNPINLQNTASGRWIQASGPGTLSFEDSNKNNTSITWDRIGVYKLYWEVSNGSCGAVRDSVLASVGQAGTVDAGPDKEACFDQMGIQLEGNDPDEFNANGAWQQVSGPGTITFEDPTQYNTAVRWDAAGEYQLEWRIFNGCNNQPDLMSLRVYEQPSVANAALEQVSCTDPPLLTAVEPIVGIGTWEALGDGDIVNPQAPVTEVAGLSEGSYTFRWTVSNGVCSTSSQLVSLSVEAIPAIAITAEDIPCYGESSGRIQAAVSGVATAPSYQLLHEGGAVDVQDSPLFDSLLPGTYELTLTFPNGCVYEYSDISIAEPDLPLELGGIARLQKPSAQAASNGSIALEEATGGTSPYQYKLEGLTEFQASNIFDQLPGGDYTAVVSDQNGCEASLPIALPFPDEARVINAFSPNNDGINDTWELPFLADYPNAAVVLFDNWGKLIFEQKGAYTPWDGKIEGEDAPIGSYYYIIRLNNGEEELKGSLTIIR